MGMRRKLPHHLLCDTPLSGSMMNQSSMLMIVINFAGSTTWRLQNHMLKGMVVMTGSPIVQIGLPSGRLGLSI